MDEKIEVISKYLGILGNLKVSEIFSIIEGTSLGFKETCW